jgi:hypothetical protein
MSRESEGTPKSELQKRLANFVRWVAPDSDKEDAIRTRAESVRKTIKSKASDDRLVVKSTPSSGSFAARTGLRRHMRGTSEVEGQDVDVPFVIAAVTRDEEKLSNLLPRFERYAQASYPETKRETTKSSVRLMFDDKLNFDLVPLLATSDPDRQVLIRSDGELRETSIQKHVAFTRSRSEASNQIAGAVTFNEMVRLVKWFRCHQLSISTGVLTDVSSFLLNLLSAHAFDARSVKSTYAETLADWFGHIARVVRQKLPVAFIDYTTSAPVLAAGVWSVIDPVNRDNNIVSKMSGFEVEELADWFEDARDATLEAIVAFDDERETAGLDSLGAVFGNGFHNHSEGTP